MSFILDALKKSERERQRTAVPGISDLPIVVHSSRSSPWAGIVVAASLFAAAGLAWVWWQSSAGTQTPTAAIPAADETRASGQPEPTAQAATVPTTPPATRSLASEATRVASVRAVAPPSTAARADAETAARARGVVTEAPMSILEARAAGMSVPELTLELLVFSEDPRQRFVYINASKYVEGDTLAEGPRLTEISSDGAMLTFNGRTFLLPQN